MNRRTTGIYSLGLLVIIVITAPIAGNVLAERNNLQQTPQNPSSTPAAQGQRYRIGAGDVLDIRILNRPQLSREAVRVEGDGMIRMPLIEGEIQAACKSEGELANEIPPSPLLVAVPGTVRGIVRGVFLGGGQAKRRPVLPDGDDDSNRPNTGGCAESRTSAR